MQLAFALLAQLSAAYAAKRSLTAKRRMSAKAKSPLQVNLRRAFVFAAAWPWSNHSAMQLAFALLAQLSAAYAAKRSLTAKRRMSAETKSPLQVNLRRAFVFAAAWPWSNHSAMQLAFALLWQLSAAYAAKRSLTAKRRMSAETKSPLQVNLRRAFVSAAAWLNSYIKFPGGSGAHCIFETGLL